MNDNIEVVRQVHLAEKIVMVDGQAGCGKTLFSPIIAAFDRVELLTYAYPVEYHCWLYHLNKTTLDASSAMVGMLTDLQLYNTMMSRETNFRFKDLSSVFYDAHPLRYFKRLFSTGDAAVKEVVNRERPILNLTTHNILGISEPIFKALGDRVVILEIVRHPLYMIKQSVLNMQRLIEDPRHFTIYYRQGQKQALPVWCYGWEDVFLKSNPTERAIYCMQHLSQLTEMKKVMLREKYKACIITIPFECFVLNPWPYLKEIEKSLGSQMTGTTHKVLRKQKVPRKMIADGINLNVYKRYGWQPAQLETEQQELALRRQWAQGQAGPQALAVLDQLSKIYEQDYMGDILKP